MKKQRIYILALCCCLLCAFGACGRDKDGNNNNSVTDRTQNQNVSTPTPTTVPTEVPDNTITPDNTDNGILDGVEDVGDGIINGAEDVIDGVGDAVNDIGDGMTGDDANNATNNGTGTNGQ